MPEPAHNRTGNGALTARQENVALLLASGHSIREAATLSGSGERTIKGWNAEVPAFRERVAELRAEMVTRAVGRLSEGMAGAADCLRGLLASESDSVKLGAARSILELGVKLRESTELEQRIAALEGRAGG